MWLPDHTKAEFPDTPNSEFHYQVVKDKPVVVTTNSLKDDGTYRTGYEIYDGLLRLRQTQQPAPSGGRILTDVFYDSRGLTWKKNAAYYNENPPSGSILDVGENDALVPSQMAYTYDPMGRPLAEIFYSHGNEKWRTTTGYGGEFMTTDPPTGGTATTVVKDGSGRTVELRQHHNGAPSGSYDATKYDYDRFGRPSAVTDPAGNRWRYYYDLRGRQIRTEDPDKGTSSMTYDDGDRLVSTTDARGKTIAVTYDDLGRKTSVRDGSPTGAKRSEWTYDTAPDLARTTGAVVKGMLSSSTRYVGGASYRSSVTGYDAAYLTVGTRITIPENEGELAGTYDFGAELYRVWPAAHDDLSGCGRVTAGNSHLWLRRPWLASDGEGARWREQVSREYRVLQVRRAAAS